MKIKALILFIAFLAALGCGNDDASTVSMEVTLNGTTGPFVYTVPTPVIAGSMRLFHNNVQVGHDVDLGGGTGALVDMDGTNTVIAATSTVNYAGYTNALTISYTPGNAPANGTILKISYSYNFH